MSSTPTPERPASRRGPFWSLFPEVEAAFGLLSTGWAPLGVQGRAVAAEWPDRLIPVGELRARLLHPACPYPTRDRVLNTVLDLARTEGDPWLLVLVGLLLPGLRRSARTLLLANSGLAADLEAEMFAGLLTAIRTGPAIRARPGAELIWAARRAADRLRQAEHAERGFAELGELAPAPSHPGGHPDHVLSRAVAAGVLSADDAELIAATRLGQLSLHTAAELRAISYRSAHHRRIRAERTLIDWLADQCCDSTSAADAGQPTGAVSTGFVHSPPQKPGSSMGRPRQGRSTTGDPGCATIPTRPTTARR